MNTDKLSLLLSSSDFPSYTLEINQYLSKILIFILRVLEEMIDLPTKSLEEDDENEMAILDSFFKSISSIQDKFGEEKRENQSKIDKESSILFSQNETVNSLYNDLIPSMEYPFLYFNEIVS